MKFNIIEKVELYFFSCTVKCTPDVIEKCKKVGSDHRPSDFQSDALPTELFLQQLNYSSKKKNTDKIKHYKRNVDVNKIFSIH